VLISISGYGLLKEVETTRTQREGAERSHYLCDILCTGNMAARIKGSYLSGSYARYTAIYPPNDVDIVFLGSILPLCLCALVTTDTVRIVRDLDLGRGPRVAWRRSGDPNRVFRHLKPRKDPAYYD